MDFANTGEIRCNCNLFDESGYEKEYTWLYYNFNKNVACEVFYGESSLKPAGSMEYGHIMLLSLKIVW